MMSFAALRRENSMLRSSGGAFDLWQWMIFGSIRGLSMAKYLVIVESPAKVKTIKKFLGSNYEVAASNGHIRDLPKSAMGIDFQHELKKANCWEVTAPRDTINS